ncbi:cytochrome P450 alkane hydroxylase, putative [Talaromyces stipitatus ATCC 10500]|uniref:Cytochrome P450 alkane hydroxylase, putative n=1 Tax=Talaromyces stipitatus (strain ATCC 10500 / CBS 375.48 / QM 6759 / NRRL 1006) TaxID=441959 RepID=B8MRH9_TALSN|nr:cytochrome P450 alkane hydroxylase, putative [Talaromyces stipitatus ATCC 10500]EED13116.1 cytochrome P450 alkane hydroxylase, putative [Talaromyces stipitatus ATCC 10500]
MRVTPSVSVFIFLVFFLAYRFLKNQYKSRAHRKLEIAKGCQPLLRTWKSRCPWGIDILHKAYQHESKKQILQFFLDVIAKSGNTFQQYLFFSRSINTVEPENIEAILSTQFEDFGLGLRPIHFDPLMGNGISTQDGTQWRHSRQLLQSQFMSNRLNNLDQIKSAVDDLAIGIPENESVDMQPLFFRLTLDTTLFLLFRQLLPSLKSQGITDCESEFADAFKTSQEYLAQRGRLGDFYWLLGGQKFRRACGIVHDFVDSAVQMALKHSAQFPPDAKIGSQEGHALIDALIQENKDPKYLRSQCLNILLAGRDATACCLIWTLRLLVQHPHVLSKLRREVKGAVGVGLNASEPTISQLKELSYLTNVIKEVLRLYPSVPVNSRTAIRTTTLPTGGGPHGTDPILVHKGEAVGYCVYAMHRRKDIYGPDAEAFRPERWEDQPLATKARGWAYLPFNGGPRACPGQEFALLETGYTIVRILQMFETIEMVEGRGMDCSVGKEKQVLTLVLSSGDGCWVRMRKYQH